MAKTKIDSIPAAFQASVKKRGSNPCVYYKKDGTYISWSWNEMDDMVRKIGCFLLKRGIKKNEKIGIFSENRWEWWASDLATLSIGATDVPIYATDSADEALFILKDSDVRICFVSTADHLARVLSVKKKLPKLQLIVTFDKQDGKKKDVISLADALEEGAAYKRQGDFDKRAKEVKMSDLATIIYTSGTTGTPKGVMLSHSNFVNNTLQSIDAFSTNLNDDDLFFSILPLSHALERTTGFYVPLFFGIPVAFVQDVSKTLLEDLAVIRPTVMVSVPRIFEKIHAAVLSKLADASPIKKGIFGWAMKIAQKNIPYNCNNKPRGPLFAKQYDLADKMIFSKLRAAVGFDNLNFVISGGGPLSVSDAEFFLGMGIKLCEGYGLTETSPVTNANRSFFIKQGTVGPALKDTQIKISDDGEILIKGPQVMVGYYKDKAATKATFTKDGFLKSGDKGTIDQDGFLAITGRIKDVIITAGGKNIAPQVIEGRLKSSLYIEQVALIGDRRKYLSSLIVPEFTELAKWAKKNGVTASDRVALINNEKIIALIDSEIKTLMQSFARVEQIRRFTLLPNDWTQDSGELTPSLKVKRHVIEEKYVEQIEAMYIDE